MTYEITLTKEITTDLKRGVKAAHRLEHHQQYYTDGLQVIQPDLDSSVDMDPSFALRADMIIQLHALVCSLLPT